MCLWPLKTPTLSLFNGQLQTPSWSLQANVIYLATFALYIYKNFLNPRIPNKPILVNSLKMKTHCSQSSRENAIPFGSTSPSSYYQEVPSMGSMEGKRSFIVPLISHSLRLPASAQLQLCQYSSAPFSLVDPVDGLQVIIHLYTTQVYFLE